MLFRSVRYILSLLVRCALGAPPCTADLFEICVRKNVLIRDCSNYPGLGKGFYRVAVRTHEENEQLIRTIHDGLMEERKKAQQEEEEQ